MLKKVVILPEKESNSIIHIFIPTQEDKERMNKICGEVIDIIEGKCKNIEEQAFCLKMLIEAFQEYRKRKIPIE